MPISGIPLRGEEFNLTNQPNKSITSLKAVSQRSPAGSIWEAFHSIPPRAAPRMPPAAPRQPLLCLVSPDLAVLLVARAPAPARQQQVAAIAVAEDGDKRVPPAHETTSLAGRL
jgi:hypothetical protein